MKYTKPPLSLDQQIELLIARGLDVGNRERAKGRLAHLNYYRLRGYWIGLEEPCTTQGGHRFRRGATLDQAINLYIFDRRLRLLVMDAIERVEVSVRSQWVLHLSMAHGAHAYLDASLFHDQSKYHKCLETLQEEVGRSKETFITHYRNTYDDPLLPPLWAVAGVMSLGQLSRWYDNIHQRPLRQSIADIYGLDERVLRSFLRHLTYVRNLCAHHARLWNRRFTITMQLPSRGPNEALTGFNPVTDRNLYNTLVLLGALVQMLGPASSWPKRVCKLLEETPDLDLAAMGFPDDWNKRPLWRSRG